MAAPSSTIARVFFEALRPARSRPSCQCFRQQRPHARITQSRRNVTTASSLSSEMEVDAPSPRWAQTPPAMKAPFTVKLRTVGGRHDVNKDPQKLDDMYARFLGSDGPHLLSEETKWLAVTHKSFDHGRRGFNERLAFLGKRILELQTSIALVSVSETSKALSGHDAHGREAFSHPAIDGVECLSEEGRSNFLHHTRLAKVARDYDMPAVVRWVPKNPASLLASGSEMVYAQVIYAIVGAIALEQGGAVANRIAKERVLQPLGIGKRSHRISSTATAKS